MRLKLALKKNGLNRGFKDISRAAAAEYMMDEWFVERLER